MPNKAFLEITNVCNRSCSFCHGTKRPPRFMTPEEFTRAAGELRPFAEYLYFHLMGEPLLHPELSALLHIAESFGFRVILTTNGTLLPEKTETLLQSPALFKVSVSLHSFEANPKIGSFDRYLEDCFTFCEKAAKRGIISVFRLWNVGGENTLNPIVLQRMHEFFDDEPEKEWKSIYSGYKIRDKIFLEWGERFDWPDPEANYCGNRHSCYGLRDQVGVLSDGTVVPCCLDADGVLALGNIFTSPLSKILSSERARALKRSFELRRVEEPLCQRCGYAAKR